MFKRIENITTVCTETVKHTKEKSRRLKSRSMCTYSNQSSFYTSHLVSIASAKNQWYETLIVVRKKTKLLQYTILKS